MRRRPTQHLAAFIATFVLGACASTAEPRPREAEVQTTDSVSDFEALFRARTDSARMRFTEADVRFMHGMISHHAQALVMAALVPTHSSNPQIRTLAARIVNAQQDEIATMQQWLRERGQPVPEVHTMGGRLMVHGADHALMPGMLTPEQLRALEQARGAEFDRLFLRSMIEHHRGAVVMVHDLFRTDGAGQDEAVFKFASDVQVDQTTEIDRMELMLAALPDTGGASRPLERNR